MQKINKVFTKVKDCEYAIEFGETFFNHTTTFFVRKVKNIKDKAYCFNDEIAKKDVSNYIEKGRYYNIRETLELTEVTKDFFIKRKVFIVNIYHEDINMTRMCIEKDFIEYENGMFAGKILLFEKTRDYIIGNEQK